MPDDYLVRLEHPDDSARRILREQTGIDATDVRLAEIESFNGDAWHLVFHYVVGLSESAKVSIGDNVAAAEWFQLDALPASSEIAHSGWALEVIGRVLAV